MSIVTRVASPYVAAESWLSLTFEDTRETHHFLRWFAKNAPAAAKLKRPTYETIETTADPAWLRREFPKAKLPEMTEGDADRLKKRVLKQLRARSVQAAEPELPQAVINAVATGIERGQWLSATDKRGDSAALSEGALP